MFHNSCLFVLIEKRDKNSHLSVISLWQSDSHNLKYMGIDALSRLIRLSPEIAEQHQLAVIDCLEVRAISGVMIGP